MSERVNNIKCHKTVCTEVVGRNLCIGCGLCAAMCPRENLKIEFNRFGEFNAMQIGKKCGDNCNLCLKVCPFHNNEDNEDTLGKKLFANTPGIKHTPETGYYLGSFVGYSNVKSHRKNGASGGLATWTLEKLLEDNHVDCVACVAPNDEPEKLFKFKMCNTPEQVRECSRSCYYPVETSEVIRHILQHEGRYAIIGLPCVCKAVRLAMQLNPKLERRLKFVLGLVCGQTKSKFFAEYICAMGGGDPHFLSRITFRIKDPNRPASDYGMKWICKDKSNRITEGVVFWTEGMNRIWSDRYFTPNACNFCDDIFAELADACFMDAWLSAYKSDFKGTSIVLVRKPKTLEYYQKTGFDDASLRPIKIDDVIESQIGVVKVKRDEMKTRAARQKVELDHCSFKRKHLLSDSVEFGRKRRVELVSDIASKSPQAWIDSGKDIAAFNENLNNLFSELAWAKKYYSIMRLPGAIWSKVLKRIGFAR